MMPASSRGATSSTRRSHPTPWLLQPDMLPASRAIAEFIGTLLLQLLAGTTTDPVRIAATYTGLMACFSRQSGGHLNPAVSLAAALSGHMPWMTATMNITAQVLGALVGAVLQTWLIPGLALGQTYMPSCHAPSVDGMGGTPLFVWEAAATFAFVYVLYPALFAKPGFGVLGPLIAGVTLLGVLSTAGAFTSFSPLNPALTFAGSLVFNCSWRWMWMYLLAHLTGAGLAALLAVGVFGTGPNYLSEAERADYMALSGEPGQGEAGYYGTGTAASGPGGFGGMTQSPAGSGGGVIGI